MFKKKSNKILKNISKINRSNSSSDIESFFILQGIFTKFGTAYR